MEISVNGKTRQLASAQSIAALLEELGLDALRVAVELNRDILPRDRFAEVLLGEGDALEVVQFVGGG